jgi:hypothetical protein
VGAAAGTNAGGLREHLTGMAVGLVLGLVSNAYTLLISDSKAYVYLGVLLAGIGFVYLGFAVADGRVSAIAVQIGSAAVFLNVAFIGASERSAVVLGLGYIAHGAWDWLHHNDRGPTHVRTYYPPFCVVADVVIGVPLLAGWVL